MENKFSYTYKALSEEEKKEILSIRKKYLEKEIDDTETKFERLKRLNNQVKNLPTIMSLTIGILGTLILGLGMSMVLVWDLIIFGVILGVVGIAVLVTAYPIYKRLYEKNKETAYCRHDKI